MCRSVALCWNGNALFPQAQSGKTQSIKWNFTKFLVDKTGTQVERFGTRTPPKELIPNIEKLLAQWAVWDTAARLGAHEQIWARYWEAYGRGGGGDHAESSSNLRAAALGLGNVH
jgi:hypothetical protein